MMLTDENDQVLDAAKAAFQRRDFKASAEGFRRLVSSPAHAADGYYGLGMIALAQGQVEEAEKLFNASLSADSSYANAWYQLGRLRESHSPAEASRLYREALRHNPQHAGALRKLGTNHSMGGVPP